MRSGIILAGGNSSRFGEAKAFHPFRGKAIIEHVFNGVSACCGEVLVVVRDNGDVERYGSFLNCRAVADIEAGGGPLVGMCTGLLSASGAESLVVGADMPLLSPSLVEHLFGQLADYDAVVPRFEDGRLEPLLSVYRTTPAAAACKRSICLGKQRVVSALEFLRVKYIPVGGLRAYDSGLESLININTRDDLDAVVRKEGKD